MIDAILNSSMMPWLEQSVRFGEKRQEVLAGNIANIDTPEYRTRDLPVENFQQALRQAIESSRNPQSLSLGAPGEMVSAQNGLPAELFQAGEYQSHNVTFHDEGNRSIEHEVTEMTKNMMMQSYAMELMISQMNTLQSIISERP